MVLFEHGINVLLAPTLNFGSNFNLAPLLVRFPPPSELQACNIFTLLVIDNHRVLHGRSAFDGKRRMCGAYVGVDEYRSKLAVLTEQHAPDSILRATNDIPLMTENGRNIWNSSL